MVIIIYFYKFNQNKDAKANHEEKRKFNSLDTMYNVQLTKKYKQQHNE